ncbi:autotransporter outer membrane beta-barrel domain-containing protein [Bartonella krasnovii]|uniref:Autotransporter outer membrane beta-barrel domain-containing protein n=1 Tax=Bartonella krasnovii TaxID=2267275 RepID=A0A5B9D2Z9_9HYPH|nr:autotransporter outer membrane beta-barrel domain-containing protein [Bartonella krasnovii]QEE12595.1 autotransporter outer membrane beta-barrel domain-containing protein [Bartonella krasnovii]UNF53282.1 autotransporter outer membrane beta-barrel domain-containing protein [Bartonella krasnovii]
MAGLLKNRFSLCTFTTALLFLTHHIDGFAHNAESQVLSGKKKFSCDQNAAFYQCDDGEAHEINNKVYSLTDQNAHGVHGAIEASKANTSLRGKNITVKGIGDEKNNSEKKLWKYGVKVSEKAGVSLSDSTLSGVLVGVESQGGLIAISGGSIDAINVGALAGGKFQSSVYLTNTQVNFGDLGVKAGEKGVLILEGVSMSGKGGASKGGQGKNADHQGDNAAFHISGNGYVQFVKGSVNVSDAHGLLLLGNKGPQIDIGDSNITVKGNAFHGMHFEGQGASEGQGAKARVDLKKTRFVVPESIALYSSKSGKSEISLKDTKLFGDLLLKAEGGSSIKVTTNASALVGQTQIDNSSIADLILKNNSQWALLRPRHKNLQDPDYRDVSFISSVNLVNSSIVFEKPKSSTAHTYQTLYIGKGSGVVYQASGDAWIHLNARLNPHDTSNNQVTDRLLIHGDVSGKTIVNIQGVAGGLEEKNGKAHSVSIIQVYGNAWSDSFQLNGQYVALDGAPYKYVLRSYSPKATGGEEHVKQRFAQNGGAFWNFRLENEYVQTSTDYRDTPRVSKRTPPTRASFEDVVPASSGDVVPASSGGVVPASSGGVVPVSSEGVVSASSGGVVPVSSADSFSKVETVSLSGSGVRSVVPQVPTYLILPNSLFHAGLIDISNQNKQLEVQRAHPHETLENRENPASFLRGYGGSYRYTSDLSALEYGYGGDLGYYALEAGVLLQKIENVESVVSFGVMGSYGKLSLQPLDVEQSQKSTFDKWTATVYGSLQHDTGFYVDGLVSYGLFQGDVVTTVRGKTATLKGNPLSVSLMSGQKIATGYEGVVFVPQVQVVYQYLQFNEARDIDHFNIEMDKLDQWVVRVGGRLMKTLSAPEKDRDVSFYGKIHFAHDFGKERSVRFKDSFQLGAFGSSLEAGLGLNAHLSQKFVLHGDLVYQHKLSKGGFSGISFSGGLRYRF